MIVQNPVFELSRSRVSLSLIHSYKADNQKRYQAMNNTDEAPYRLLNGQTHQQIEGPGLLYAEAGLFSQLAPVDVETE